MLATLKSYARSAKWLRLYRKARSTAARARPDDVPVDNIPVAFVFGCGRSGTTILGRVLSGHPEILYYFEPYHLWTAIDVRTDMINMYHRGDDVRWIMDGDLVDDVIRARFDALLMRPAQAKAVKMVVEKTPINAMRIGYLDAIAPNAKYVSIVRDCVDVARSVEKLAKGSGYSMAHRPRHNQWWGDDDAKWKALMRDGRRADYFADELPRITTHATRGAYEWLVSMIEIDQWRQKLGDRLHELRYEQLLIDPQGTLTALASFLGRAPDQTWLEQAAAQIQSGRRPTQGKVETPPQIATAINQFQQQYRFPGRAISA